QWLMTASLQGKFIEYDARFRHIDGLNEPQFTIIDSVTILPMEHVVRITDPADDLLPDFLADARPDENDLPDEVHSSTNEVFSVSAVTSGDFDHAADYDHRIVKLTAV